MLQTLKMVLFLRSIPISLVDLKIMTEMGKAYFVNDKRLDLNVVTGH